MARVTVEDDEFEQGAFVVEVERKITDPLLGVLDIFLTGLLEKNTKWHGDWLMHMAREGDIGKFVDALLYRKARLEISENIYISIFPCSLMNINWCHLCSISQTYVKLFINRNIFQKTEHSFGGRFARLSRCRYDEHIDSFVSNIAAGILGKMLQYWLPLYTEVDFKDHYKSFVMASLMDTKMRILSVREEEDSTKPLFALQTIDSIMHMVEHA